MPVCNVCPYPIYTDEARHVKMQGTVTLRVLVGADGRASEIRVVRGVGYGLEERAVETVRGWKFTPARDARAAACRRVGNHRSGLPAVLKRSICAPPRCLPSLTRFDGATLALHRVAFS